MLIRNTLGMLVVIGVVGFAGTALGQGKIQDYFNDTALEVKATESPILKREILSKKLSDMSKALEMVKRAPLTSDEEDIDLDRFRATLQERSDELAGANGFDRVPDEQLNAFSTYIVQDMEQADQTITIGVVTLLLILIIIILIA